MAQKMSKKKKASAIVAGALAVTLALGGAYAWVDYSQTALNTFKIGVSADVLLHDDFNGQNKDVYVENTGESDVYVRVKFAEYLQIGNGSVLTEFDKDPDDGLAPTEKAQLDDVTTWPVHQFKEDNDADGNNICSGSASGSHTYYEWKMTGAQKAYLAGVTEADSNGRGGLTQEEFDTLDFGIDFNLGTITTQKKWTEDDAAVMLLSEYLGLGTTEQNALPACWLLDTDGWAYWSKALKPDTATNLLLDEVVLKDAVPYDNWEYDIDVQLQAASVNEMDNWYADGTQVAVANPDNSIATTTLNGYNFIQLKAGNYIVGTDGLVTAPSGTLYISLGGNAYREAQASGAGYVGIEGTEVIAGQDQIIGTDDDNMLSGRSADWGGEIEIDLTTVDYENRTYGIKGADADFVVTTGIDKVMGTYDDVITSLTGALGQYDIDGGAVDVDGNPLEGVDDDLEYIGWNYFGGPLDNMLVATEYVLDNLTFNNTSSDSNNYAGSVLMAKLEEIGDAFIANGMNASLVNTVTDLDMSVCSADFVRICTNAEHDPDTNTHTPGSCTYTNAEYYTSNTDQANITDGVQFFALSIDEIVAASGDGTTQDIYTPRRAQGALKWLNPKGTGTAGLNNKNNGYKDGNGNTIFTTNYWLRSPGYTNSRCSTITSNGYLYATVSTVSSAVGARPACYLNLSSASSGS